MMAQSGCDILWMKSELAVLTTYQLADIGDGKSIEQSPQSLSSHMVNILNIIKLLHSRALVILDELGAVGQIRVKEWTPLQPCWKRYFWSNHIATTHYSELKAFARGTDRASKTDAWNWT